MTRPQKEPLGELYARQTILQELGVQGQEKLLKSKVAIIGMGGLGSSSSLYLALAGVGYLRLIDQDTVEKHNLHRQALYTFKDLRYPKVEVAARRLQDINQHIQLDPVAENLRRSNVDELIGGVDCVVDGLDNMTTRYILNSACVRYRIPYIFGGAIGFEGNITISYPPETPCLECVFPDLDDRYLPTCDARGVLGATVGIIGSIQAMETIKLLTGIGSSLKGRLLVYDFKKMESIIIDLHKNPNCPICQAGVEKSLKRKENLTWLCGRDTINVNPSKPLNLDLSKTYEICSKVFKILARSSFVLVFEYQSGVEVSLFRQGRVLLKNVRDEETALKIYREISRIIAP